MVEAIRQNIQFHYRPTMIPKAIRGGHGNSQTHIQFTKAGTHCYLGRKSGLQLGPPEKLVEELAQKLSKNMVEVVKATLQEIENTTSRDIAINE